MTTEQISRAGDYLSAQIAAWKGLALNRMIEKKIINDGARALDRTPLGDIRSPIMIGDSASNFLIGQTEVFDPTINEPLTSVEFWDNITCETVPFGADSTSFVNSTIAGGETSDPQGIAFSGSARTDIGAVTVENVKSLVPVEGWAHSVSFDVFEIARAQMAGFPLETQKLSALQLLWQKNVDICVHLGAKRMGTYGLLNNTALTPLTASTKAATGTRWVVNGALHATPDEIRADVNALERAAWIASGYSVAATDLLLDPVSWGILNATLASNAGTMNLIQWLSEMSICRGMNGKPLNIRPSKFLLGTTAASETGSPTVPFNATGSDQASAGTASRAVAYSNERRYVRFRWAPPYALTQQFMGTNFVIPYVGKIGGIENVYSDVTMAYMDGI